MPFSWKQGGYHQVNVREGKGHVLDPNSPKFDRGTPQKSRIKLEEFSFFLLSRQETYQIMDRFFKEAKTSPACSRICVEASMDATWKIPVLTRCAGHQPNSRVLYTHYKDSLLKGGWPSHHQCFRSLLKLAHIRRFTSQVWNSSNQGQKIRTSSSTPNRAPTSRFVFPWFFASPSVSHHDNLGCKSRVLVHLAAAWKSSKPDPFWP